MTRPGPVCEPTGPPVGAVRACVRAIVPRRLRWWVRARQRHWRLQWPRAGSVDFGALRRLRPLSRLVGAERGLPLDRYYIEDFLATHANDVRGHVLEFGDDTYARRFGATRVTACEVLDVGADNPRATVVADLGQPAVLPADRFDCIICTQTLQMIYDVRQALTHLHRMLKPGGVLLLTAHGISRITRHEGIDPWGEYWHFTTQSLRRLLGETMPGAVVEVAARGNVLAAIALLHGLAADELTADELRYRDPDYEVIVTARVVKAATAG
jgi:SAM-dependent methyltransferase